MAGSDKDASDKDSPARRVSGLNGVRNSMHRQKSVGSDGELNGQQPDNSSHEVRLGMLHHGHVGLDTGIRLLVSPGWDGQPAHG